MGEDDDEEPSLWLRFHTTYAILDRKLEETVGNFNIANDKRIQARTRVINIRSEFNTHLNENVKMPVDLAEVEDLCKMIEEKDKVLMLDLMRVKDQINHNLVASEGWSANAKTASAI